MSSEPLFDLGADRHVAAIAARIGESLAWHRTWVGEPPATDGPKASESAEEVGTQADFDRSLLQALDLIAQHVQHVWDALAAAERRASTDLSEVATRAEEKAALGAEVGRRTEAQLATLAVAIEDVQRRAERAAEQAERAAEQAVALEQRVAQELEQLRSRAEAQSLTLAAAVEDVRRQAERAAERAAALEQRAAEQAAALEQRATRELEQLKIRMLRAERAVRRFDPSPIDGRPDAPPLSSSEQSRVIPSSGSGPHGFDYFAFEQQFRGSRDEIKRRQAAYIEFFRGKQNVLDVGAGRGEFLELLAENGVPATGVDMSEDMVEYCHDRGLRVVCADALEHLAGLPDCSLDGVFTAQLVEHLEPSTIVRLIGLCAAKLKPGGTMVAETVNTGCPAALASFYLDPTHVRPVPWPLLRFIFEQASFAVRCIRFSSPVTKDAPPFLHLTSSLLDEASTYADYAVVASRR
jgi:2-polyprenyl-3-methyl-5-hydroxy-6-metoxy-1,4-benzoquinol methylase